MSGVAIGSPGSPPISGRGRYVSHSAPAPTDGKWAIVGSSGKLSGGRKGVVGFGGRNDGGVVLKEVRDVLNRIRWDLAEVVGVDFSTVKVYVEDDADVEAASRLCRQWVREGRCERGRGCKYSHNQTFGPQGLRPSSKSSGSMAPWRVLEGYALEACMSSSSVASASQLHRSLFIEFDGELVWDKEDPEVWDNYVARVERGSCSARSSVAASDSLAADDSDLDLSKEGGASLEAGPAHEGNDLLHRLPPDLCVEVFTFLSPSETARCRQACVEWRERVSEPEVWSFFLDKTFHLSFASTYGDARRDYEHLACVCRNAQAFADQRVPAIVSPGGGGAAAAGGQQLPPPPPPQAGEEFGGTAGPTLRRFAGHNKAVMALHVDDLRDRLVSAAVNGEVRVWELHSGTRLGMADLRAPLSCMAVGDRSIWCGTARGTAQVIDRDDLTSVQTVKLCTSSVCSLCLLPAPTGLRAMFAGSSGSAYVVAGLGNGSFVILHGTTPLHAYSLPVSPPACVAVAPTGPEGFIAAASPDKLFVWSGPLPREGAAQQQEQSPAVTAPPLRVLHSSDMRGSGRETRHSEQEPCDVVMAVMSEGVLGRQLVVTACNHDLCLRWYEMGGASWGGGPGSCTHMTEAFNLGERGAKAEVKVGTLALAHAKGVLLSAHMDGSLVVWHVGQRARVAVLQSLPHIEMVGMVTSSLGVLSCFERHVIYTSEIAKPVEEPDGDSESTGTSKGEGGRRSTGRTKGPPGSGGGKPRRRKTFPMKGSQSSHNYHIHH